MKRSQFSGWQRRLRCESLEDRTLPAGDFLGMSPVVVPVESKTGSQIPFNDNDNDADDLGAGVIDPGSPNLPLNHDRPAPEWNPLPMPQPVSWWIPQPVSLNAWHLQPAPVPPSGMGPLPRPAGLNLPPIRDLSNSPADSADLDPEPFHLLVIHLDSTAPDMATRDHLHDKLGLPPNPASAPTVSPLPVRVVPEHAHLSNASSPLPNSNFSSIVNSTVVFVAEARSLPNSTGTDTPPIPRESEGGTDVRESAGRRPEEMERIGREEIVELPITLPELITGAIPVDLSQIEATAQQYLQQIANISTELPEGMDWVDVLWMSSTALFLGGVACVGWIEQSQSRRKRLKSPLVQNLSEIELPI